MIHICGPRNKAKDVVNTTSRSNNWSRGLSPFFLGPIEIYGGYVSQNMENAWQYAKVYSQYVDENQNPTKEYFVWAMKGWSSNWANRYPMGRGAKPLYSWWDGKKLDYVQARKVIYCPLYAEAVQKTDAYKRLQEEFLKKGEIYLWDFDGYDHRTLGMSYEDVLNCKDKKMGHAFVLAMCLENKKVWENVSLG